MEHRCSNCWVAQYQIKSDVPCRNQWRTRWDSERTSGDHE